MLKYDELSGALMGFSDWWESTFSADKFNANKALRHVSRESTTDNMFSMVFLDLARDEIAKQGRLLSIEEVERLEHRVRIQARHQKRVSAPAIQNVPAPQETTESTATTIGTLPAEVYDRMGQLLQSLKTIVHPILSEGELTYIRILKLKTAHDNVLKIVEDLTEKTKVRNSTPETERALRFEITRWSELAGKINGRLYKKIPLMEFKDYVSDFDKSFHKTRRQA